MQKDGLSSMTVTISEGSWCNVTLFNIWYAERSGDAQGAVSGTFLLQGLFACQSDNTTT